MAARMPGAPPPGAGAPPAAEKKGEVNELRTVRNPGGWSQPAVPRKLHPPPLDLQLLKAVNTDRDSKRKRDVIKKVRGDPARRRCIESTLHSAPRQVIAYMTLGIDVSRLFSDMILVWRGAVLHAASVFGRWIVRPSLRQACNTRDVVIKKMIYLFLCTYAQANPELSLLAINTLQKDW